MRQINDKYKNICASLILILPKALLYVHAADPKPNEDATKAFVTSWVTPFTNIALWAIPSVTILAILLGGIFWMMKDEETREQKSYKKTAVILTKLGLILELLPTLLKLVGF